MSIQMSNGDLERDAAEEEIGFLPRSKDNVDGNTCNSTGGLLSREDLLNLDKKEPKWRRWRIILLIMFWFIWLGLLVASIVIIVLSPRCPTVPDLSFWQSKIGYWVDPFAFRDSDGDLVGDFKGLIASSDYVKSTVGAGFLLLDRFVHGQYSNDKKRLGLTSNLRQPDTALGTMDDFRAMIKAYHRIGVEVVISLDFNSVAKTSDLVPLFKRAITSGTLYARDGSASTVMHNGVNYYSSFGSGFVDLDLSTPNAQEEIKNTINHWFGEGVDGILLSNAAFFFEGVASNASFILNSGSPNEWFKNDPSRQIFQAASFEFVQIVREWVDEISKKTGKPKLLAVDPGNTGYGISKSDYANNFLGTKEKPGAHLVISRQFVENRGWKNGLENARLTSNSIMTYRGVSLGYRDRLALTTATPSDRHVGDLVSLASTFLLPGTTLLYYGAELGQEYPVVTLQTIEPYPKDRQPMVDNENLCHLPMPWDEDGSTFSSNSTAFGSFMATLNLSETVEKETSAGRGEVPMQLVQALVELRKAPSFQWGKFREFGEQKDSTSNLEIFIRKAEGYRAFVNVLLRGAFSDVIRFPAYCKSLYLRLAYPLLPQLQLNKEINNNLVFIKVDNGPAIYVFECNDI